MSGRVSVIGKERKGPSEISREGRTASRTSCRPTKGRFPPSAESLCTRDDRFGQPEADKSLFGSAPAGLAPEPNARLGVGVMGEAGDFKCLTLVNSGPVPLRRGFSLESSESPAALRPKLAGDRPPLLVLGGFPRGRHDSRPTGFSLPLMWCRWPAVAS